jgi:hypothetical protein
MLKPTSSHLQATMAAFLSSLLAGSALLNVVNAQDFSGGGRDEDAFSYIQPVDTVILTEYGSSPAVYPSRKSSNSLVFEAFGSDIYQQRLPVLVVGRLRLKKQRPSLLS